MTTKFCKKARTKLRKILGGVSVLFLVAIAPISQAAVVLQYHHVSEISPAATSVTPALFRQHMAHLKEAGYAVLPLQDLVARLKKGESLPDRAVAITFDDGYQSVYREAFPILRQYDWPFTVFVNTRPHDQGLDQFVTWDQLREMARAGATIANHSVSHPHMLRRRAGESESEWRERMEAEVVQAQTIIAKHIGQNHRLFAYPYGEYDRETRRLLKELDFVAFGQQSGPLSEADDLQALPRFPFGGPYGDLADFKTKAASLPMPLASKSVKWGEKVIADIVLPAGAERPQLRLELREKSVASRVRCFASGQGAIPVRVEESTAVAQALKPLPVGRSRYNCTAPSGEAGRFYWYSQVFIRKKPGGEWYAED